MKLNKKQKQFLFENYYVDSRVLDAALEPGWQNYFIRCFDWKLVDIGERWSGQKYGTVKLVDNGKSIMGKATKGEVDYTINLIFQGNDYFRLLKLAEKKA